MMTIRGYSADELYKECWWRLPHHWKRMESRNGPVLSVPEPVMLELVNPRQRVVFNTYRDANPFFHLAEVVWMFAGSDDVRFIEQFNKRYREYADRDSDRVHGAYGARWINSIWNMGSKDQIAEAISLLRDDPDTRQVVISMWDAWADLGTDHNDRPCNTQVMFRSIEGVLDMLVTNRSNDLVWGALGANVVHFSYLHELIAHGAGLELGRMRTITNNLHFYPNMPNAERHGMSKLYEQTLPYPKTIPLLAEGETWKDLHNDCVAYLRGDRTARNNWMATVAVPMMEAYLDKPNRQDIILEMPDCDWKTTALEWMGRRRVTS